MGFPCTRIIGLHCTTAGPAPHGLLGVAAAPRRLQVGAGPDQEVAGPVSPTGSATSPSLQALGPHSVCVSVHFFQQASFLDTDGNWGCTAHKAGPSLNIKRKTTGPPSPNAIRFRFPNLSLLFRILWGSCIDSYSN